MLKEILDAIRCQTEEIKFLDRDYIVREVDVSRTLKIDDETEQAAIEAGGDKSDLAYWMLFVNSVFRKEDGLPAFVQADIAELRKSSRIKLAPLLGAVDRVNGLDAAANAKK